MLARNRFGDIHQFPGEFLFGPGPPDTEKLLEIRGRSLRVLSIDDENFILSSPIRIRAAFCSALRFWTKVRSSSPNVGVGFPDLPSEIA